VKSKIEDFDCNDRLWLWIIPAGRPCDRTPTGAANAQRLDSAPFIFHRHWIKLETYYLYRNYTVKYNYAIEAGTGILNRCGLSF
jgi:hypothetical protein